MNKRRKSGFSIAEAVIALTVIVIVSISALSAVLSSSTARRNTVNKTYAQNFANSAWESFKAASSASNFAENLNFAEGITLTPEADASEAATTPILYKYESAKHKFRAKIQLSADMKEFQIYVTDLKGNEIISFSYTRTPLS